MIGRAGIGLTTAVLLLAGGVAGCATTVGSEVELQPPGMPPLAKIAPPIVHLTPHSQRYRIAVLNFRDQTGRADLVKESIADMLTTELYATRRFNLYDRGDVRHQRIVQSPVGDSAGTEPMGQSDAVAPHPSAAQASTSGAVVTLDASLSEQFRNLRFAVDGILTGYVTAISFENAKKGWFSTDFRIVNPDTMLVVYSDSAVVHFTTSQEHKSIQLARGDVKRMADKIRSSFIDLSALMRRQIEITDVVQDQAGAKVVLNVGAAENNIKQGFAGFVVERDERTKVEHYIAKFVIVNVFPEASVGMIVPHCNRLYGCTPEESDATSWVLPQEQVGNVRVGAQVRMK